jgi:hypothetical protein
MLVVQAVAVPEQLVNPQTKQVQQLALAETDFLLQLLGRL